MGLELIKRLENTCNIVSVIEMFSTENIEGRCTAV